MKHFVLIGVTILSLSGCSKACNLAQTLRELAEKGEDIACSGQTISVERQMVVETSGDEASESEAYSVEIR